MQLIAHRGNLSGSNPKYENQPDYILSALINVDVEVDAWYVAGPYLSRFNLPRGWYLGHDQPTYQIPFEFLSLRNLWVHLKNIDGVKFILDNPNNIQNYFVHHTDFCAITSGGYIWTCDMAVRGPNTVLVCPTLDSADTDIAIESTYLCTDWACR